MSSVKRKNKVTSYVVELTPREAGYLTALIGKTTGNTGYKLYQDLQRMLEEDDVPHEPGDFFKPNTLIERDK